MKKTFLSIVLIALTAALSFADPKPFKETSAAELVLDMKTGWNLGNTLDAPSETAWGQPRTSKAMFDKLAETGIKTIRIPVSWSGHMDKDYKINETWMKRVKEIVDWALEDDLYVIINSHHDCWEKPAEMTGLGYYPNTANYEKSAKFLTEVWTQVGEVFKDYDEHLVFETMNEPRQRGTNYEWWFDQNNPTCKDAMASLNKLNQVALDTIRATGGNNQKRYVMIPGLRAAADSVLNKNFILPKDDEEGKLIISVHMYDPYEFAMQAPGTTKFTEAHKSQLKRTWGQLNTKFISQGVPVIIGEYGATNKGNTEDRVAWFEFFISESRKMGMCAVLWDNGAYTADPKNSEHFGYFFRNGKRWYEPRIIDAINKSVNQ